MISKGFPKYYRLGSLLGICSARDCKQHGSTCTDRWWLLWLEKMLLLNETQTMDCFGRNIQIHCKCVIYCTYHKFFLNDLMFTLDYKCFKFKRFFNWLIRVLCCPGTVCVLKCMWLKYFLYIHTRKVRTCTSFEVFGIQKAQLLTHPRLLPGSKILTKVWFCTYFTITINIRQNSTFRSPPLSYPAWKSQS